MFAPLAEAAVRAHPCSPMESSTARTERVSREGKSSVWSHTADGVGTSASCAQALEGEGGGADKRRKWPTKGQADAGFLTIPMPTLLIQESLDFDFGTSLEALGLAPWGASRLGYPAAVAR